MNDDDELNRILSEKVDPFPAIEYTERYCEFGAMLHDICSNYNNIYGKTCELSDDMFHVEFYDPKDRFLFAIITSHKQQGATLFNNGDDYLEIYDNNDDEQWKLVIEFCAREMKLPRLPYYSRQFNGIVDIITYIFEAILINE